MISLLNGPVYLPPHVREAMGQQICDLRHPKFKNAFAHSKKLIQSLLHAENHDVFIATGSGTFGVELVLRSILKPTDMVLALVTGTFSGRLADIAEMTGARIVRESSELGDVVSIERIKTLLKEFRPAFVACAHVEPSTATQFDISLVAQACREYGAQLIVDGVCAGFAIDVDCNRDGIAAYITASQKGLSLPPGICVGVVNPSLSARAMEASDFQTGMYGSLRRWISESISFTPSILHVFALEKSLEFIERETMSVRETRHRKYSRLVKEWGQAIGLKPVPMDHAAAWTLSAFHYPIGLDDKWLVSLRDQSGLELAPSNDPRLAGAYFRIGHLGDLPESYIMEGLSILDSHLAMSKAAVQI